MNIIHGTVSYDMYVLYTVHNNRLCQVRLVKPGVVSQHANLAAWMARVEQLPGIKEYLESRPLCIGIGVAPKLQPRK